FITCQYYSAMFISISAILNLSAPVLGIPFSSNVRPITEAPYFLTIGNIVSNIFSSPFTELTMAFPLYTLNRSEEHTSELQSRFDLVCRLLLEKKKYMSKLPYFR